MNYDHQTRLEKQLEPSATAYTNDLRLEAQLSQAISLKRIADKLDSVDLDLKLTLLGNQLLDIAYQAGVNFRCGDQDRCLLTDIG